MRSHSESLSPMNLISAARANAVLMCAMALTSPLGNPHLAQASPCASDVPCAAAPSVVVSPYIVEAPSDAGPSWIFARSTYSHDPMSGARVAQYLRKAPVEPLDDPREITSRYRRSRTNLRGVDGSVDTYYEVQHWGNGRGGLDAEWERFHDAWKESYLTGGYFNSPGGGSYPGGYGNPATGYGGFPQGGFGFPGQRS